MYFRPIEATDIITAIRKLRNINSVGCDDVSVASIKAVSHIVAEPLADILNMSVSTGKFPSSLKVAKVSPVHKSGCKSDIENYRPISMTSVFSKVFEFVVKERVLEFLEKFNVLSASQHGFRAGCSTETAAINYVAFIYERLDVGEHVIGLFFDMSRAFDSLLPEFVREKLFNIGIRGQILDWLISFLTNRSIRVAISGAFSSESSVDLGVPQGSILGPLIFLLFVNDMPAAFLENDVHVSMYADDTSMAVSARDPAYLSQRVQLVVEQFTTWCRKNRIMLNLKKTTYVNFHSRRPIKLNTTDNVSTSSDVRFLGVCVDEHLNFQIQVDDVVKKINKAHFALLKLKSCLVQASLLDAYYALCYSHLSYCCLVWGNAVEWKRVFIAQKRVVRLLFDLGGRESCRDSFIDHSILTFSCIYILKAVVFVRVHIDEFEQACKPYNTRNSLIPLMQHRSALFERGPWYSFVRLYNKLPEELKRAGGLKRFKLLVKKFLLGKAYYTQQEYLDDTL